MQRNSGSSDLIAFSSPMNATRIQQWVSISFPQSNSPFPPIDGVPALVSILFYIVATMVIGGVITVVTSIIYNASQPVVSREARVIAKRQTTHQHFDQVQNPNSFSTATFHYVTFEFPDRKRQEFRIAGGEYGLLVEGDRGILHSQGSWFKSFERRI